ncbi:MAG: diacylglycerol/lipid kinase family protein [Bacteroidota bacterium]
MDTLIIVNPRAAGGRAKQIFQEIKKDIDSFFGSARVAVAEKPEDVAKELDAAAKENISRLIVIGGDGTNHNVVNALAHRPGLKIALGFIPVGTGCDWSRTLGMPRKPQQSVAWLARAQPHTCDVGKVEYIDTDSGGEMASYFFLNIASAGVSGEVDSRVNRAKRRTSFTFLRATVTTLLKYKPQHIAVECDGEIFYTGKSFLLVVANGRYFGRGMWIAPHALIDDGLFDVLLIEGVSRLKILFALQSVYSGKHISRNDVRKTRARTVYVHSDDGALGLDLDGEEGKGEELRFTVIPEAVNILLHPTLAAIREKN